MPHSDRWLNGFIVGMGTGVFFAAFVVALAIRSKQAIPETAAHALGSSRSDSASAYEESIGQTAATHPSVTSAQTEAAAVGIGFQRGKWPGVIVHHSVSGPETTADDIDRWHRERGWDGCGYHIVIEAETAVVTERGRTGRTGAHCRGYNDLLGVCVVGDFRAALPTERQLALLRSILDQFDTLDIYGHGELGVTECPGDALIRWLVQYKEAR